ncbi:DMT family transporter [Aestuariivirga sp.]|uniref:DMT family transporter n=1 Tax=Aestuariivirga sp. TaxID=2650926 RepID=UPI00391A483A
MSRGRAHRPLLGIALMLTAMAILPFLDAAAKHLGNQGVPVLQVVWARLFFGTLLTMPFALRLAGLRGLVPNMPVMHTARAIFLLSATSFFFWGLHYLPIADTLAIFFVQPLIVTMLSPFVLGEKVGVRRWLAVVVGFIGTLIIIRPGFQDFNPGVLMALAAGTSLAIYMLLTRKIAGSAPAMVTTFYTSLMGAIIVSALVVLVWEPPTPSQWGLFVLLALIANGGHYLIVKAYDHAEASLLAPLAYTEMIMATAVGWYFFGDFPDLWTFVGVAILIACAIYISVRERIRNVEPIRDFEQP